MASFPISRKISGNASLMMTKPGPGGGDRGEEACAEWYELGKIGERRKWFVFRQGRCHLILFVT